MKKLLLGSACLAYALASPALAADMEVAPAYKASPLSIPTYDWTGFYIGVNAGYSWGKSANTYTITGFPPFTSSTRLGGDVVGGQAGYNWEVSRSWVIGIEADFQVVSRTLLMPGEDLASLIDQNEFGLRAAAVGGCWAISRAVQSPPRCLRSDSSNPN